MSVVLDEEFNDLLADPSNHETQQLMEDVEAEVFIPIHNLIFLSKSECLVSLQAIVLFFILAERKSS